MNFDQNQMRAELERDEDRVPWAYPDSLGYWTISVGRLIDKRKGGKLYDDEMDFLTNNDIVRAFTDIEKEPWFQACKTDTQRRGLINMRFQLGAAGIRTFTQALASLAAGNFAAAGQELRQSLWYHQTEVRAERVIRQIEQAT